MILQCATPVYAAGTCDHFEYLPHGGADYFGTEVRDDEEDKENISDFVTVYDYQYIKGSLKSGAWRNGTSGGSTVSAAKLSMNYTNNSDYNILFTASVSGSYTNGGTILTLGFYTCSLLTIYCIAFR